MEPIEVYGVGLIFLSACADDSLDKDAVERAVNQSHPAGTTGGWQFCREEFKDDTPNPTPCNDHRGRTHYLFEC